MFEFANFLSCVHALHLTPQVRAVGVISTQQHIYILYYIIYYYIIYYFIYLYVDTDIVLYTVHTISIIILIEYV